MSDLNNIKKYTVDGREYEAGSARELVQLMNEASFSQCSSPREYMLEAAERTTMQNGSKPRIDTFDHFVLDLISAGMIKELP